MTTTERIDKIIDAISTEGHVRLFYRWLIEYKRRYYGNYRDCQLPKENSDPPGFERNFLALIFGELNRLEKDPHAEWPYSSYLPASGEHADLHFIDNGGNEVWFELGMYAFGEENKYKNDFEKLRKVVAANRRNIGVLIHFELYKKQTVITIFRELKAKYEGSLNIDIRKFGGENQEIGCRLVIQSLPQMK